MAEYDDFPEQVWNEFQWEKFLKEQDVKTNRYFQLLEKYMDHPDRDILIAREMGWQDFGGDGDIITGGPEVEGEWGMEEDEDEDEEEDCVDDFDRFIESPVYRDTLNLHRWINRWLGALEGRRDDSEAIRFATTTAVCGAKLAAALSGGESAELGMTIAYLKRALKASNDALDSAQKLEESGQFQRRQASHARRMVFRIRNFIVDEMAVCRAEWRKRYGED